MMKVVLIQKGVVPPRIRDLAELNRLLTPLTESWSWPVEKLRFLTVAAVGYRYPGDSADQDDAVEAMSICARLREALHRLLPRDDTPPR